MNFRAGSEHVMMEQVLRNAAQNPMFAPLSTDDLEVLLGFQSPLVLKPRQRLFAQGEFADNFYYVVEGQIKLYRLNAGGSEQVVGIVGPGTVFAEAAMFQRDKCYPVNAEALTSAVVLAIDSLMFYRHLEKDATLCLSMLATVCQRLHARLNDVSRVGMKNAEHRLAWYLLDQIEDNLESQKENSATIELAFAKGVLASRLSMMPETLSRSIARLVQAGVLESHGAQMVIVDIAALKKLVSVNE